MTDARPALSEPPIVDIDFYSDEVIADPYPFYAMVRETAPVVRFAKYGVYGTARYDEVIQVTSDHERFTAESGIGIADARIAGSGARPKSILVEADPPAHTMARKAAMKILSPGLIRSWRPMFEQTAARLVERALDLRDIDGISDLVEPYLFEGFPAAMGIRFDSEAIRAIGYMTFNQTGPRNALFEAGMRVGEPYSEWFAQSCERRNVIPGSFADKMFEAELQHQLPAGGAANIVRTFVRAGTDTTLCGIASTLRELASNPEQWNRLRAEPGLARNAFDEALRMEAPVHVNYRATNRNVLLGGYRLDDDTKIAVFPGGANHDSRKWSDPDSFDIRRTSAGVHTSFGNGRHNCIGQNIARLEAECLLVQLAQRAKSISLSAPVSYKPMNQLRMPARLPLQLSAI